MGTIPSYVKNRDVIIVEDLHKLNLRFSNSTIPLPQGLRT